VGSGAVVLRHCAKSLIVAGVIAGGYFVLTYSFQPQYFTAFDSACNRNEYQEYILWRSGSRCVWL